MVSRRQFLGYSALQAAAALGLSSVSLKTLAANSTKLTQATTPLSSLGRVPIVLIGTGYGNAVTALRLAERGRQVVMLEMGQLWTEPGTDGKVFSPTMNKNWNWAKARWNNKVDGRSMWNRTETKAPVRSISGSTTSYKIERHAGVLDLIEYNKAMQVYVGRGVGGGSLVNGAMAVTPPRSSFEEIFPQLDASDIDKMYNKYFPLANKTLGVNHVDPAWFEGAECYQFARVSRASAERTAKKYPKEFTGKIMFVPTTYDLDYLKKEQAGTVPRSALDQEVIFGNNAGKRSLDKTYLAQAVGTGNVSIYTLQQVTDIHEVPANEGGGFELTVKETDKKLNPVATVKLRCNSLFLGAGSCGTSELLVRARAKKTLPKLELNDAIGQGWGNNGNIMAARAGYPHQDKTGLLQSTIPLLGINDWNNKDNPVFCEITPLPVGYFETHASMYLAITKTPERGFFEYNSSTNKVTLQWKENQNDWSRNSADKFWGTINKSEGTGYRVDLFNSDGDIGKKFGDNFTYHPLGGCILGKATDNYGRIREYPKLYVTDGSLLPGVLGVNPFVTITALAERNIERIIAEDFSK